MPPSAPKKYTSAFELFPAEPLAPSDIHLSFLQSTRTLHPSRRTVYVQTPGREEAAEALREIVGERSQQGASRVGAARCILDFAAKMSEIGDFGARLTRLEERFAADARLAWLAESTDRCSRPQRTGLWPYDDLRQRYPRQGRRGVAPAKGTCHHGRGIPLQARGWTKSLSTFVNAPKYWPNLRVIQKAC